VLAKISKCDIRRSNYQWC